MAAILMGLAFVVSFLGVIVFLYFVIREVTKK